MTDKEHIENFKGRLIEDLDKYQEAGDPFAVDFIVDILAALERADILQTDTDIIRLLRTKETLYICMAQVYLRFKLTFKSDICWNILLPLVDKYIKVWKEC